MAKKATKKSKSTAKRTNKRHFVRYVEDSFTKIKFFKKKSDIPPFISDFLDKYPNPMDGYWVDYYVTDATFFQIDQELDIETE